jgi:hypothetical protein
MDLRGCPTGYFTDRILVYQTDVIASLSTPSCDQPVAGWLTLGLILLILRAINVVTRLRARKKANKSKRAMSPSIAAECIIVLAQAAYFILTSANVANTVNSVSGVLHGIFAVPLVASHLIFVRGMIKLGYKVIPLSKKLQVNLDQSALASLKAADTVLRTLAVISIFCPISILVAFITGAAAFPSQFWPFEVAFFIIFGYQVSTTLMAVWQIERCKVALQRLLAENLVLSGAIEKNVARAATTMLHQQVVIVSVLLPNIALNALIALGVIPLYWWLLCLLYFSPDTLMFHMVAVLRRLGLCKLTRRVPDTAQLSSNGASHVVSGSSA